jgi:putative ABC transport system substrate-binding protein
VNRRAFLSSALGATVLGAFGAPLAAEIRGPKVHRLGALLQGAAQSSSGKAHPLRVAMRELGYVVGKNLILDVRWAGAQNDSFAGLAAELVALNPTVIVADSTPAALAAKRATSTIPIVMVNVSDPVGSGLVASLAHPGGNVTGGTDFGAELAAKSADLLHEIAPKASRFAVIMSDNPVHPVQLREIETVTQRIGVAVVPVTVKAADDFAEAYASISKQHAGAVIVLGGAPFSIESARDAVVALSAKAKLPAIYTSRWWVDAGGLISYGPSAWHRWRTAATYVARIFKGVKPADLPVQQPTEFELVINLKTAKELGLVIPPSLLLRADEVIQ